MEKRELPETQCPILKPPAKEATPTSPPAANESASAQPVAEERRVAFNIGDSEDGDKERRVSFDIGDSEDNEYRSANGGEC